MPGTTRFDRFVVKGRLGVGGMGEVFRAQGDEGEVALKLMRPEIAGDAYHRRLFLTEARLGRHLSHPNLVRQLDCGESHGTLWLALELVDGVALDRVLKAGPLAPDVAAYVALALLDGLGHMHARGLVHRDVSATNVLLSRTGAVKLSDFGVAKVEDLTLTGTNEEKGKPSYMAPELLREHAPGRIDGRVDLFALGVLLHRMTTGEAPFSHVADWLRAGCPLASTGPLAAVIACAMAPAREDRFANAQAMAAAIHEVRLPVALAAAPLAGRVLRCLQRAMPVDDLDRIVIAALCSSGSGRERTRAAARADVVITGEIAMALPESSDSSRQLTTWQRPAASRARRVAPWLALFVTVAAIVAMPAVRARRPEPTPPPPRVAPGIAKGAVAARSPLAVAPPVRHAAAPRSAPPRMAARTVVRPLPAANGWLTLDTQPWAVVYLDGRRLGTTPFAKVPVPAGRHRLSVDVEERGPRRTLLVDVAPHAETQLVTELR